MEPKFSTHSAPRAMEEDGHDGGEVMALSRKEERDLELSQEIQALEKRIMDLKQSGIVLEHDPQASILTKELQKSAREVTELRYGLGPYYIEVSLSFPDAMLEAEHIKQMQTFLIETAPLEYVPYSVYMFMEVARKFSSGAFHRNAGHVLQALVRKNRKSMAFQEYDPRVPHRKYTLGYAGRPGGPAFYISTEDNTRNHGPGSQGSETEADGCFGKLADTHSIGIATLMKEQPGAGKSGFITPRSNWISITGMRVIPRPSHIKKPSLRGK